jgi:hypothetical protein
MACGPAPADEPELPGVLEYEHPHVRIHRLDRRIDIMLIHEDDVRRECGMLSERAHADLEEVLDALDPHEDYGYDPDRVECIEPPGARVYIEGFEHSPFSCEWYCCRPELVQAALIYSFIERHFLGGEVVVDGEPYVVIEPDEPCPESMPAS